MSGREFMWRCWIPLNAVMALALGVVSLIARDATPIVAEGIVFVALGPVLYYALVRGALGRPR